ncbi:hypothetical protein QWZ13_11050 [Reinekea marina]|uniref:hypothetical protein n=1 Tax=Reinekea marina TaxID=1310421 RepID=UPI0025B4EF98|nr:hypothetical protein [Reinekea marina]MDN3649450.1 hypothetical protein [Reinekea marina]
MSHFHSYMNLSNDEITSFENKSYEYDENGKLILETWEFNNALSNKTIQYHYSNDNDPWWSLFNTLLRHQREH